MNRVVSRLWLLLALLGQAAQAVPCADLLVGRAAADPYGLLGVTAARPSKKELGRYWRDTGLGLRALPAYVANAGCYASEIEFLKCVAAINGLLQFLDRPARLLPAERAAVAAHVGAVRQAFTGADVVELKDAPAGEPAALLALQKRVRAQIESLWLARFRSGARLDFETIAAWAGKAVPADDTAIAAATAINAWLGAEDAHARITPEAVLRHEQTSDTTDELVGIGVVVTAHGETVIVQQIMEGSPAEAAGIRPFDVVTHIDGNKIAGPLTDATKGIRGQAGTTVRLRLQRRAEALELSIVRRAVSVKNVTAKLHARGDLKVGYIKLGTFMARSAPDQIARAIADLEAGGAEGLVLDLRNNPGGEINVAVRIASLFVGEGKTIVRSRSLYPGQVPSQTYVTSSPAATALPLVVLVNSRSASASELLSGALQDLGRALVVGDRTFGKGTVQASVGLDPVLAGMPIVLFRTIARFHLPSGRTNQLTGIVPDFLVHHSPNPTAAELFAEREEDVYPNALPALGRPYRPLRPDVIAWFSQCVERTGAAKRVFEQRLDDGFPLDYQLLFSADIVRCYRALSKKASVG